ncbi:hypothetical protein B0H13DRAFT_1907563 [Mycena leptocephala]|nr:hypothetical protein B0H13DRAFT_1907563 [Mycena leptocephala]
MHRSEGVRWFVDGSVFSRISWTIRIFLTIFLRLDLKHWSRLELRTHDAFAAVHFKASLLVSAPTPMRPIYWRQFPSVSVLFYYQAVPVGSVVKRDLPTQRHLVAQLANILHAIGTDAECACSGSSSAVPTVLSLTPAAPSVSLPGLVMERERGSGSDMGQDVGTEDEERGEGGERECVIRVLERVVFPPASGGTWACGGVQFSDVPMPIGI